MTMFEKANLMSMLAKNGEQEAMAKSSKQRLKWTPELHEQFINAVTQLGGAERATPKGVLKLMGVQGLTIYHIKSHLQKYRLAKYIPDSMPPSDAGSPIAKKSGTFDMMQDTSGSGIHLTETLRVHVEVQKRLQEQLEVQRQLQLRIEAQGRYLQNIIEEQERMVRTAATDSQSKPSAPTTSSMPLKESLEVKSNKHDLSASELMMEDDGFSDSGASSPSNSRGENGHNCPPSEGLQQLHQQTSSLVSLQMQSSSAPPTREYQTQWSQTDSNSRQSSHMISGKENYKRLLSL